MGIFDFFKKKEYGAELKEKIADQTQSRVVPQTFVEPTNTVDAPISTFGGEFIIEDVFTITGRGTVVTGQVMSGTFNLNDIVTIKETGMQTQITGIEMFRKRCVVAQPGDKVGICLRGIARGEVNSGFSLIK